MEPRPNQKTAPKAAAPYAQAAYDMARDLGAVDDWQEKLGQIVEVMLDPEIRNMPHDPGLDPETIHDIMNVVLDDLEASGAQRGFVGLLIEEGKLSLLPWIYDGFVEERKKAEQGPDVTVVAARKLSTLQQHNLKHMLKSHFKTSADPEIKVDSSLASGFKIVIGERTYDQSVRGGQSAKSRKQRGNDNTPAIAAPRAAKKQGPRTRKPGQNKKQPPRPGSR